MIRHIKCVLFILPFLLLSCSGNKHIEGSQPENISVQEATDKITSFGFVRSFQFCDNPYGAFSQDEADQIYRTKEIQLSSTINQEAVDWNAFFYDGAKECVERELNLSITSSYLYSNPDEAFPFDSQVIFNDEYVIVAQDGFFFVFQSGKTKEFKQSEKANKDVGNPLAIQLASSETIALPFEYSYDLVNTWNDFVPFEEGESETKLTHLSDFHSAKLSKFGEVQLLLVSGVMESGQSELYLFSLNDKSEIVDQLQLYTFRETEDGGVGTFFSIDENYVVTIKKKARSNRAENLVDSQRYELKKSGKFRSMQ